MILLSIQSYITFNNKYKIWLQKIKIFSLFCVVIQVLKDWNLKNHTLLKCYSFNKQQKLEKKLFIFEIHNKHLKSQRVLKVKCISLYWACNFFFNKCLMCCKIGINDVQFNIIREINEISYFLLSTCEALLTLEDNAR